MNNANTFPSADIIQQIQNLPRANASASELCDKSADEIATIAGERGGLLVDITKVSKAERIALATAQKISPSIQLIEIGQQQDEVLRALVESGLSDFIPHARVIRTEAECANTLAKRAFEAFLFQILTPKNSHMVRHEWKQFIVGPSHMNDSENPWDSHHCSNLGLLRASEGPDKLREDLASYIRNMQRFHIESINRILKSATLHPVTAMNEESARFSAVLLAMVSNFFRGAAFYYLKDGEKAIQYAPRMLALQVLREHFPQNFGSPSG